MAKNKAWKPSNELVHRASEILGEIDHLLAHNRHYEADVLSNKEHETLGNGLGLEELDEIWIKIQRAREARVELIKDLILQGELSTAKSALESSSFSPGRSGEPPLSDEERTLWKLLRLKQRERRPQSYDWRGDPHIQFCIELARLTPSQTQELFTLLESGRLRPHKFPSYSISNAESMVDNFMLRLITAFRSGDLYSEDVIKKYEL